MKASLYNDDLIKICPSCNSNNIVKNGHIKRKQRYLCKDCSTSFGSNNQLVTYRSRQNEETWIKFIDCVLKEKTLLETSKIINVSKTTCFNMRSKLLKALPAYDIKYLNEISNIDSYHLLISSLVKK